MRLKLSLVLLMLVVALGGCYNRPVRHLTSDVALLTVGKSTMEDVLVFLGDPDERQKVEGGEIWIYRDEKRSIFRRTPYIGQFFDSSQYRQVIVRIQENLVTACTFTSSDADDLDWADDFSWQEKDE